ncbi:MAG TPA: hypothetical protein VH538_04320 [Gaiellaceae bacterium]|jgi:hypothetical protein
MTWVAVRLQRTETLITAVILLLIAGLLIPTGLSMAHAFSHDRLSSCVGLDPSGSCANAVGEFESRFESLFNLTAWFTLVPGIVGVMLAAPFVLELENGTFRLAWTQSITRRRWIATKLAVPIATGLLLSGVLILLFTWWRGPFVHLNGRMDASTYDSEGTVVIGYTLFALGLALVLGVVLRRAVIAITLAFIGYFVSRIFVDTWLRQRLVTPVSATWKSSHAQPANIFHADIISVTGPGLVQSQAGPVGSGSVHVRAVAPPFPLPSSSLTHAVYQPPSHFWPLQLTETGLFLGIALVLIAFAAWWTHERVA